MTQMFIPQSWDHICKHILSMTRRWFPGFNKSGFCALSALEVNLQKTEMKFACSANCYLSFWSLRIQTNCLFYLLLRVNQAILEALHPRWKKKSRSNYVKVWERKHMNDSLSMFESKVERREEEKRCCTRFQELRNIIKLVFSTS